MRWGAREDVGAGRERDDASVFPSRQSSIPHRTTQLFQDRIRFCLGRRPRPLRNMALDAGKHPERP
jgi:hypothetical protein